MKVLDATMSKVHFMKYNLHFSPLPWQWSMMSKGKDSINIRKRITEKAHPKHETRWDPVSMGDIHLVFAAERHAHLCFLIYFLNVFIFMVIIKM